MDLIANIKNNFNKGILNRAMKIEGLDEKYPAWTIKGDDYIGVIVPYFKEDDFFERFSSATIKIEKHVTIGSKEINALMLCCNDILLRDEFSVICSEFVFPGSNGKDRIALVDNPQKWWENWRALLGNTLSNSETYSMLGELCVVEYLRKQNIQACWSGIENGTHDVETPLDSYEVKSTTLRYGYEVTISSIYQLKKAGKHLYLVFCRFEHSNHGRSLDDQIKNLVSLGYSEEDLESHMRQKGFEKGRTARAVKYKLLEMKLYLVNESFPFITEHSFKNNCIPANVTKINYTIDLSGIECKNLL